MTPTPPDKVREAMDVWDDFTHLHNPYDPIDQQLMVYSETIRTALNQYVAVGEENAALKARCIEVEDKLRKTKRVMRNQYDTNKRLKNEIEALAKLKQAGG